MVEGAKRSLRPLTHRNDDLLVGYYGAVSGGEYSGHRCLAARIDLDFPVRRELDRTLQPVRVRCESDLYEHAGEFHGMEGAALPILVDESVHALAVAGHFGGLRTGDDRHVGQASQLGLEDRVGAQLRVELDERDVADESGEIDRALVAWVSD